MKITLRRYLYDRDLHETTIPAVMLKLVSRYYYILLVTTLAREYLLKQVPTNFVKNPQHSNYLQKKLKC